MLSAIIINHGVWGYLEVFYTKTNFIIYGQLSLDLDQENDLQLIQIIK
jgi:hypothetical protein